jgi:hypothetical protein
MAPRTGVMEEATSKLGGSPVDQTQLYRRPVGGQHALISLRPTRMCPR